MLSINFIPGYNQLIFVEMRLIWRKYKTSTLLTITIAVLLPITSLLGNDNIQQEGQHLLTGQHAANFRRDLEVT